MRVLFGYVDFPVENTMNLPVIGTADLPLGPGCVKAYAAADRGLGPRLAMDCLTVPHASGPDEVAKAMLARSPDAVAFGCYVWNADETLAACRRLKRLAPGVKVVVGGPEVPCDGEPARRYLKLHPGVDVVVRGEGEETFGELARAWLDGGDLGSVRGIAYRRGGRVASTEPRPPIEDIGRLPSPYLTGDIHVGPRATGIVVVETSRGCPYACAYCAFYPQRERKRTAFPVERLRRELDYLKRRDFAGRLYIADSALNVDRAHAVEVFTLLSGYDFHTIFDLKAELWDDALIAAFSRLRRNYSSLGIQTTNPRAIKEIRRSFDPDRSAANIQKLLRRSPADLRVDLILGLPGDDREGFERSLDWALGLRPIPTLTIFDLVVLPNSRLGREAAALGVKTGERGILTSNATFCEAELLRASRLALAYNWMLEERVLDEFKRLLETRPIRPSEALASVAADLARLRLVPRSRLWLDARPPKGLREVLLRCLDALRRPKPRPDPKARGPRAERGS
ncbi:MAG: B12-binding domain-containing radical SAM protein [Elusimicrobia bacterium]|nr:B12-binding domain-containing radical SAM protein [Elusimicrobiota bacterium]